jgi:hypothetical protein
MDIRAGGRWIKRHSSLLAGTIVGLVIGSM